MQNYASLENLLLFFLKLTLSKEFRSSGICETYVRCFEFKILNDIVFTNFRLAKIGLMQNDLCA